LYKIIYDQSGNPTNILHGILCIPIDEHNRDFREFLAWNAQQGEPLDWQSPIEVEDEPGIPSVEERLEAIEAALLELVLGG
jgi:hypothetical protein